MLPCTSKMPAPPAPPAESYKRREPQFRQVNPPRAMPGWLPPVQYIEIHVTPEHAKTWRGRLLLWLAGPQN